MANIDGANLVLRETVQHRFDMSAGNSEYDIDIFHFLQIFSYQMSAHYFCHCFSPLIISY